MNILENELEEVIYQNSFAEKNRRKLRERGLPITDSPLFRQTQIGRYGITDLMGVDITVVDDQLAIQTTIYELKKGVIDINALTQLCRYMAGFKHLMEHCRDRIMSKHGLNLKHVDVNGMLIGKDISHSNDFVYLYNQLGYRMSIYNYSIDLEGGLLFKEVSKGWLLDDGGFNEPLDNGFSDMDEMISIQNYFKANSLIEGDDNVKEVY